MLTGACEVHPHHERRVAHDLLRGRALRGDQRNRHQILFAGTQRIALRKDGVLTYVLSDHLGSTSIVTDANGAIGEETDAWSYGLTDGSNPNTS